MKAKLLFFLCLIIGGISSFICIASLIMNMIYDAPFNTWWFIVFFVAVICLIIIGVMDYLKNKKLK